MGLFDFFKKKNTETPNIEPNPPASLIIGMVLSNSTDTVDKEIIFKSLFEKYNYTITQSESNKAIIVFNINNYRITIASLPTPIPGDEVEITAKSNYFWENAINELKDYKSHILVSLLNAGTNPVEENIIFTRVVEQVLIHTDSLGLYMGTRNLLIKKEFYLDNMANLVSDSLPIYNLIFIGFDKGKTTNVCTRGMSEFGHFELEILKSSQEVAYLLEYTYNIIHYILLYNVKFKDGETVGISADQKFKISISNGLNVDGNSIKIAIP